MTRGAYLETQLCCVVCKSSGPVKNWRQELMATPGIQGSTMLTKQPCRGVILIGPLANGRLPHFICKWVTTKYFSSNGRLPQYVQYIEDSYPPLVLFLFCWNVKRGTHTPYHHYNIIFLNCTIYKFANKPLLDCVTYTYIV